MDGALKRVAQRAAVPALVLAAITACSKATTPDSVQLAMLLPAGMWTNVARSIGRVEVWIDEGGTASLFSATTELAASTTPEGIAYQYQITDIDGDGRYEFWIYFPSSPFGNGRSKSVTLLGSPSIGTFIVNAAIYRDGTNALLATARATTDSNGYAIQFSGQRNVTLQFDCEPLLGCPVPADGGAVDLDAGPEEGNVTVNWNLPQSPNITMDTVVRTALGPIDLTFDEIDGGALFTASAQKITARTSDSIAFEREVADVDGDGLREFQVRLLQNPFGNLTTWPMSFSGTSSIPPFAVRGRLYANDGGTLVAQATATLDMTNQPIRFASGSRTVNLDFRCVSESVCKAPDSGVSVDAGADAGDAGMNASDAGDAGTALDAGPDAGADAGAEADSGTDAGAESDAGDGGGGGSQDAGPDASPDAGPDAGTDAGSDAGPTPLSFVTMSPRNGSAGVSVFPVVTAYFDTPLQSASITSATFYLSGGPDASIVVNGKTATLTPLSGLDAGATYTVTVTTGATNVYGAALSSNTTTTFSTLASASWIGVRELGSWSSDSAKAVTRDPAGNVYILASSNAILVPDGFGNYKDLEGIPYPVPYQYTVVIKYDTAGGIRWIQRWGSDAGGGDTYAGIAADDDGSIYVSGQTVGEFPENIDAGPRSFVLTKLDTTGNVKWHRQFTAASNDYGAPVVAVGPDGMPVVAGGTKASFDNQTNSGGSDIFVRKFDSDGGWLWTQFLGGGGDDYASGVAVDADGGIFIAGYTYSNPFDGKSNSGSADIVVAKFAPAGPRVWSAVRGTSGSDWGNKIAVLPTTGEPVVCGSLGGNLDGYTSQGNSDIVVIKYSTTGSWSWTLGAGTYGTGSPIYTGYDSARACGADSSSNIYVTGMTGGGLDENSLVGVDGYGGDIFLMKINSSGTKQWTRQLGSVSGDTGISIAVSPAGDSFLFGDARGSIDGGAYIGNGDFVTVKYNTSGVFQ